MRSPQPKSVAEVVTIYLGGWSLAGVLAGYLASVAPGRFPLFLFFGGGALGVVIGALASRRAAEAFRRGRGPALVFPGVRRWALGGAIVGYVTGTAVWLLWDRIAPESRDDWFLQHPRLRGLFPMGLPALGYLVGMSVGFVRAAVKGPPPDVTEVFE